MNDYAELWKAKPNEAGVLIVDEDTEGQPFMYVNASAVVAVAPNPTGGAYVYLMSSPVALHTTMPVDLVMKSLKKAQS